MKIPSNSCVVDADVLLQYLVRHNEEEWSKADATVQAMSVGKLDLVCDPVTLSDVVWRLEKSYRLARHQIHQGLEPIVASPHFHIPNKNLYIRALELYGSTVPHFGDACACARAIESSEGRLLSFDKKLSSVPGVERMEELTPDN